MRSMEESTRSSLDASRVWSASRLLCAPAARSTAAASRSWRAAARSLLDWARSVPASPPDQFSRSSAAWSRTSARRSRSSAAVSRSSARRSTRCWPRSLRCASLSRPAAARSRSSANASRRLALPSRRSPSSLPELAMRSTFPAVPRHNHRGKSGESSRRQCLGVTARRESLLSRAAAAARSSRVERATGPSGARAAGLVVRSAGRRCVQISGQHPIGSCK